MQFIINNQNCACKPNQKKKKKIVFVKWVPVSSIGKISDSYIKDLGFNPYTKNWLMSWSNDRGTNAIRWNSLKKKICVCKYIFR